VFLEVLCRMKLNVLLELNFYNYGCFHCFISDCIRGVNGQKTLGVYTQYTYVP
jgi:hypothetical protein